MKEFRAIFLWTSLACTVAVMLIAVAVGWCQAAAGDDGVRYETVEGFPGQLMIRPSGGTYLKIDYAVAIPTIVTSKFMVTKGFDSGVQVQATRYKGARVEVFCKENDTVLGLATAKGNDPVIYAAKDGQMVKIPLFELAKLMGIEPVPCKGFKYR